MRIWVCSLLLLLVSCSTDALHRVCAHKCYSGPKKTQDVGECQSGMTICADNGYEEKDENGNVICEGEVLPSEELCDLKDNNCNGMADDVWLYNYHQFPRNGLEHFPCPILGECWNSTAVCDQGEWACRYEDTVELPQETRCDKKDNDCDGRIDDNIFDEVPLGDRICYSGNPTETLATPPCRAGLLECVMGETICLNEIIPGPELCDRIDNDCNGVTDDTGDVLSSQYDIVFIIDTSGSMCGSISAVAGACNAYAEQFDGNPNFRFALVIMSELSGPLVQLDTDFTDFATIRSRLLTLGCNGSGLEASMDSIHNVCDQVSNPLALSWNNDANSLFFMFTDERQQTYTTPPTTGQMVIDACVLSSTLPFIWSRAPADFQYIAQGANGAHFTLVNDWQTIFNDMNSVVITLCGAAGN